MKLASQLKFRIIIFIFPIGSNFIGSNHLRSGFSSHERNTFPTNFHSASRSQVYMRQGTNPYSLAHDAGPSARSQGLRAKSDCSMTQKVFCLEVLFHVQQGLQAGTTYSFMVRGYGSIGRTSQHIHHNRIVNGCKDTTFWSHLDQSGSAASVPLFYRCIQVYVCAADNCDVGSPDGGLQVTVPSSASLPLDVFGNRSSAKLLGEVVVLKAFTTL